MDGTADNSANPSQPGFQPSSFTGFQQESAVVTPQSGTISKKGLNKNFILIGVSLLVMAGLVLGFNKARSFFSKATGGCVPSNVEETNIAANSAEIVFQTDKACLAEIAYGTSSKEEALLLRIPEALASLNHRIRLAPMLPSTAYYYQIIVDGKNTEPIRSFLTKPVESAPQPTLPPAKPTVASSGYTVTDFEANFGTSNSVFDIDKNGIVNTRDWLLYQKTKP